MRYCLTPRCPSLVSSGRCDACRRICEGSRGTRHQRGYDHAWITLRERFVDESFPWFCAIGGVSCQASGRMLHRTEIEVDHIVKFSGLHDPLRLDARNLRIVCAACHRARHARETGGVGQ
jgi:5-methylcytosine-specific restriction endonuclease McrA